jgi:hypothetical protein
MLSFDRAPAAILGEIARRKRMCAIGLYGMRIRECGVSRGAISQLRLHARLDCDLEKRDAKRHVSRGIVRNENGRLLV